MTKSHFFRDPGQPGAEVMSMPAVGGELKWVVNLDDHGPTVTPYVPLENGGNILAAALTVGRDAIYLSVGESESDIFVMDLEW